jgi:hypothetical protein
MAQDRQVTGESGDEATEPGREPRDENEETEQDGHEANVNQVREEPVRASHHEDPAQVEERHQERPRE